MPQVPYQKFPTVDPSSPGEGLSVNAPPAAFGENVARAVEGLGSTVGQVGNELFQRATALQELQNETDARNATTQYMLQQGEHHAQITALTGKAAVDGLDPYIKSSADLREQIAGTLSSPMARKMFEAESQNFMARNIFSAATHAATENKRWQVQTGHDAVAAAMASIHSDPMDDKLFEQGVAQLKAGIQHEVDIGMLDPGESANWEQTKRISAMWKARIDGLARTDPSAALKMQQSAVNGHNLVGDDVEKSYDFVRTHMFNTGSRNISQDILTGKDIGLGAGPVSMDRAKAAIAHIESGSSYTAVTDSKTKLGRALGKYQVMEGELPAQLKEAGLGPMTPEQFLANPQAQEKVFEAVFGRYMKESGSFNDAASRWFTGRPLAQALKDGAHDRFIGVSTYIQRANAALGKSATLDDKLALGRQRADEQMPEDTLYPRAVEERIAGDQRRIQYQQAQQSRQAHETVWNAVLGGLPGQQGKAPTTVEEVMAIPEVQTAMEGMDSKDKLGLPKLVEQAIINRDKPAQDESWSRLQGIRASDPERYISLSPMEQNLSNNQRIQMLQAQKQIRSKPMEMDPNLRSALGVIKPQLDAIGLARPAKGEDTEQWDQFIGVFQDALASEIRAKGDRPLGYEDVKKVAARVLQQTGTTHTWPWAWGDPTRFFSDKVEDEQMMAKRQQMISENPKEPAPTDPEVRREVLRDRYNALFKKEKSKAQSESGPKKELENFE
jgi:hypothetical protein